MSDNVKVAVKIRPLSTTEKDRGHKAIVDRIPLHPQIVVNRKENFTFNYVFDEKESQVSLYTECVQGMLDNLFNGYNVTILAYGQTGSGKTYTMGTAFDGSFDEKMGVIPRATSDIFDKVVDRARSSEIKVTCSFIELYQEQVYDLLSAMSREKSIVEIREDTKGKIIIPGLTEISVETAEETINCLIRGSSGRAVGATQMNQQSSRSHAIFTINIEMTDKKNSKMATNSKFHLVDLAGSERSKKTNATGDRFKEGVKINQGLLALGNVISALGNGQGNSGGFVGYRDSKLTRLLQDSLGGNSVTLMIACVSPADFNQDETTSTLKYADRARKIKNKPIVNQDPHAAEINKLKGVIAKLRMELMNHGITGGLNTSICAAAEPEVVEKQVARREDLEKIVKLQYAFHEQATCIADARSALEVTESAYENLQKKNKQLVELFSKHFRDPAVTYEKEEYQQIIEELRSIVGGVQEVVEQNTNDLIEHKRSISNTHTNSNGAEAQCEMFQEKCSDYANRHMEINMNLKKIDQELALKEEHLQKVMGNMTHFSNFSHDDEEKIQDLENLIDKLEKEKADLQDKLKHAAKANTTAKISEDRRKRLHTLEGDITQMKQKLTQQAKLLKVKEKDTEKILKLNREIQEIKTARVKLVRQMKMESDNFRKWKQSKEKEMTIMKEKERKRENDIKRMESMHLKKQNVLKRKVEEAIAINKRLKDAIDKQKVAQSQRSKFASTSKTDHVASWINSELEMLMSVVEAQYCLLHLSEVRDSIQKRLQDLKSQTMTTGDDDDTTTSECEEIAACEEELEMRDAQIADLKQKVTTTDIQAKIKAISENVQSMPEARAALKQVLTTLTDIRKEYEGMRSNQENYEEKITELDKEKDSLEEELNALETKRKDDLALFEKNYEEKISVLIGQAEKQQNMQENSEWIRIQQENLGKLEVLREKLEKYEERLSYVEQLEEYKDKYLDMESKLEQLRVKEQVKNIKKEKITPDPRAIVEEYDEDDEEEEIEEVEEDSDTDIHKDDPDWKKTPFKRTTGARKRPQMSRSLSQNKSSNSTIGGKRNSNDLTPYKCNCKLGCKTKRCKCRTMEDYCNETCGCGPTCENKSASPKKVKDSDGDDEKENECSLNVLSDNLNQGQKSSLPTTPLNNVRRSVMDSTFTTPSYPKSMQSYKFYNI